MFLRELLVKVSMHCNAFQLDILVRIVMCFFHYRQEFHSHVSNLNLLFSDVIFVRNAHDYFMIDTDAGMHDMMPFQVITAVFEV